jgi:hypothetical protein
MVSGCWLSRLRKRFDNFSKVVKSRQDRFGRTDLTTLSRSHAPAWECSADAPASREEPQRWRVAHGIPTRARSPLYTSLLESKSLDLGTGLSGVQIFRFGNVAGTSKFGLYSPFPNLKIWTPGYVPKSKDLDSTTILNFLSK